MISMHLSYYHGTEVTAGNGAGTSLLFLWQQECNKCLRPMPLLRTIKPMASEKKKSKNKWEWMMHTNNYQYSRIILTMVHHRFNDWYVRREGSITLRFHNIVPVFYQRQRLLENQEALYAYSYIWKRRGEIGTELAVGMPGRYVTRQVFLAEIPGYFMQHTGFCPIYQGQYFWGV